MQAPLQVAFEGIQHSDAIEARIREQAEKLEQFFGRTISCRVVLARPQLGTTENSPGTSGLGSELRA